MTPLSETKSIRAVSGTLRPSPKLLQLYLLRSLAATIGFPLIFLPLYFRYRTLQYRFDEEGVCASWGIFFRKEVFLTYRRIQDIHVSAGILQRWLGIGTVEVQTASGNADAELAIEGMENFVEIRDYLYARMRGAGDEHRLPQSPGTAAARVGSTAENPVEQVLSEIRDDLREVRRALEARS